MEEVSNPRIKVLASGTKLIAKQMEASAGELLPAHLANLESVLFVHQGACTITMNDQEFVLKQGDAMTIPPEIKHQIKVNEDFKAVHFMPAEIKFKFFT